MSFDFKYVVALAVVLVFSASVFAIPASSLIGEGTFASPYIITNCSELNQINSNLNSYYILGNDIDCSSQNHAPINQFFGTFDGQGYSISDLNIDTTSLGNTGLFSSLGETAVVRNLNLIDFTITNPASVSGLLAGDAQTGAEILNINSSGTITQTGLNGTSTFGGLIGLNKGKIRYANTNVTITIDDNNVSNVGGLVGINDTEGLISDSSSRQTISTPRGSAPIFSSIDCSLFTNKIGGFAGVNNSTILRSSSNGSVEGTCNVAGFVGENNGLIQDSYAKGIAQGYAGSNVGRRYVSGFVATNNCVGPVDNCNPSIVNSYSAVSLPTLSWPKSNAGVGRGFANIITNTHWDIEAAGGVLGISGNLCSNPFSLNGQLVDMCDYKRWNTYNSTAQMHSKATFSGWDFNNTWSINEGTSYPTLVSRTDTIAPILTADWNSEIIYLTNATIRVNCSDINGTGCESNAAYRVNESEWINFSLDNNGNGAFLINVDSNSLFIEIKATDLAGNVLTINKTIRVDDAKPVTTISPTGWRNSYFEVTLECADLVSGCAQTYYRTFWTEEFWPYSWEFTVSVDGNNLIEFYSVDALGNTEDIKTGYLLLDQNAPTAATDINGQKIYDTNAIVSISCTDVGASGCSSGVYVFNDGEATPFEFSSDENAQINLTFDGNTSLTISVWDNAGNYSTYDYYIFIDSNAPILTAMNLNSGNNSIDVALTANDSNTGSGIKGYLVSIDGNTWVFKDTNIFALTGLSNGVDYNVLAMAVDFADHNSNVLSRIAAPIAPPVTPRGGSRITGGGYSPRVNNTPTTNNEPALVPNEQTNNPNSENNLNNNTRNENTPAGLEIVDNNTPTNPTPNNTPTAGLFTFGSPEFSGLIFLLLLIVVGGGVYLYLRRKGKITFKKKTKKQLK